MKPYVVRQGETVASIVAVTGGDPGGVWNDPSNDELRKLRGDPAVLCPGDVLQVPDTKPAWSPVAVGGTTTFKARIPTQPLKLVLRGLPGEAYVIHGAGDDVKGTTDADGTLSVDVPVTCASLVLELPDRGISQRVLVGHLDPISEPSGVRQRLQNLGYGSRLAPLLERFGVTSDYGDARMVRVFQLTSGIEPTGEADPATIDALRTAHGT
ncbi:MAG TPA: peptidoglycan-binding domain-containing protein [Polyangiaceae bacterium]|nr:peptidoglycan-binding domain-containing protein [Polyangiaceae bacterium]